MNRDHVLRARVSASGYEWVVGFASARGLSVSEVVRRAVRDFATNVGDPLTETDQPRQH